MRKTEFFKNYGGALVAITADDAEYGDFLLLHPEEIEMAKQAAKAAKSSKEFADEVAPDKTERFNKGLKFVTKHKDDRDLVDAYLKKAKDEYKLSANMIKDLKRAAGRQVEV